MPPCLHLSLSDGRPGTICSCRPHLTSCPQIIIGVWVRRLPRQLASGLTRHYRFDFRSSRSFLALISQLFFLTMVLNKPCFFSLSWEKGGERNGREVKRHHTGLPWVGPVSIFFWLCQNVWKSFKFQSPNPLILPNSVVLDRRAW